MLTTPERMNQAARDALVDPANNDDDDRDEMDRETHPTHTGDARVRSPSPLLLPVAHIDVVQHGHDQARTTRSRPATPTRLVQRLLHNVRGPPAQCQNPMLTTRLR
jgi:hypothetical protein